MSQAPAHMTLEAETIHGFQYAYVGDLRVEPTLQPVAYHGTNKLSPEDLVTYDGLPARGDDVDLIRHVEPPPTRERESAFRGTCVFPKMACGTAGAVFWAGEDGYVVDIRDYPGYNISELLDGRIPNGMGGFRGPNNPAEQETAIPARVPMSYIARCGHVVAGRRGQLVVDWL